MANVAYHGTDGIYANNNRLTPKFAKANIASGTTDGAVITAVASKKLRVLAFIYSPGSVSTTIAFNSKPAGAGTAISAVFTGVANSTYSAAFVPLGWFETVAGEGLTVTTGIGSTTGVQVVYCEV